MTYLKKADLMSPRLCRMLARDRLGARTRALSNREISTASGLGIRQVANLSLLDTWKDIPVGMMSQFKMGCGITPKNEAKERQFFKLSYQHSQPPLTYLKPEVVGRKFLKRLLGKKVKPRPKPSSVTADSSSMPVSPG